MQDDWYSVRMRAAQGGPHEHGGRHISGGEKLVHYAEIKNAVNILLDKALEHSRGYPDFMQIQFEEVNAPVQKFPPLDVTSNDANDVKEGHRLAMKLLKKSGVPTQTIKKAYEQISQYSDLSGAMVLDVHTGERLDSIKQKGIRVTRMDWNEGNFKRWANSVALPISGRLKEAITLATKVANHPTIVAELCWSDDPDYTTGYVASKKVGYQRIPNLKEFGEGIGCRIFFINRQVSCEPYSTYLERTPVIIEWEEK